MKNKVMIVFSLMEFAYWTAFAGLLAFTSMYLLSMGVSNSVIGTVIALGGIASAILQPVFGNLSDRFEKLSVKSISFVLFLAAIAMTAVLLLNHGKSAALACVLYSICLTLLQLIQPFVNALGMSCINDGYPVDFGIARATGSIGYALAAYLIGRLAEDRGTMVIPIFVLAAFIICLLSLLLFPAFSKVQRTGSDGNEASEQHGAAAFFKAYPKFTVLLLGLIFLYFGHILINNFTLQIVQTKGGTGADMGLVTAAAASVELLMMFLFTRLMKRFSLVTLLRISVVFFTLKVVGSLVVTGMKGYLFVQLFQFFGWGVMAVGLVYYVNEIVSPKDRTKGQAFATMTFTIGNITGSWIGGGLIDMAGVRMMLITGIIVSTIGTIICLLGISENKKAI